MIECIPNVSEGRRPEVINRIAESLRRVTDLRLLDFSSDASHNRSVFTFVGGEVSLVAAIAALYESALSEIDLRSHRGEHPRMGAVDVVPFVPLGDATMSQAVDLAKTVARMIAERFAVPVYLYEEAASTPRRKNLEDVRRGGFEALATRMATPDWIPDFGPSTPHPTAGASAVGARGPLVAYNVNLATDRLDVAKAIAAAIRRSGGGLPGVKALGIPLLDRGIVQVTTNVTNYRWTSIEEVFEAIRREAAARGVDVLESQFVGLVPAAALPSDAAKRLRLADFSSDQILEHRLDAEGLLR